MTGPVILNLIQDPALYDNGIVICISDAMDSKSGLE